MSENQPGDTPATKPQNALQVERGADPAPGPASTERASEPASTERVSTEPASTEPDIQSEAEPPVQAISRTAPEGLDLQVQVRGVRTRTVVFGLILLVVAGCVLISQLTDMHIDPGAVALGLMVVAGLLLIAGGRRIAG